MIIINSNNKLCFKLGTNFYAAAFSFSQVSKAGSVFFRFISIGKDMFDFEVPFNEIFDELEDPYASEADLRNLLLQYSGESSSPTDTAGIGVLELTEDGSLLAGKSAISLVFRGSGGTLNEVSVPDGYSVTFSTDGARKLSHVTYTVPIDGEERIIATTVL